MKPGGDLLAMSTRTVEVVIARGHQHGGALGKQLQVVAQDHGLHFMRNGADHIGQVANHGDDVRVGRRPHQPVVVRKPVVQV